MGTIYHETDDDFIIKTDYDHELTTVTMIDNRSGLRARGTAKLAPGDVFDLDIGQKIAYLRAHHRYLKKLERKVVDDPNSIHDLVTVY